MARKLGCSGRTPPTTALSTRTLARAHLVQRDRRGPCLSRFANRDGESIIKRTSWHSARAMKTRAEAERGRRCDVVRDAGSKHQDTTTVSVASIGVRPCASVRVGSTCGRRNSEINKDQDRERVRGGRASCTHDDDGVPAKDREVSGRTVYARVV